MNDDRKRNILIIAEGYEEKPYIDKLLSFPNINKDVYNISPAVNVKGSGNIDARFYYEMQRGYYDIILIFCDVDKGSEEFWKIVEKVSVFFVNKETALEAFIFVNPVTLQVVLLHYGDVCLTHISKKKNAEAVENLTGIKGYDAEDEQIKKLIDGVHFHSLDMFKERLGKMSTNINDVPSTNLLLFLERFESDDPAWIDTIDKKMV